MEFNLDLVLLCGLFAFMAFVTIVFLFQRYRWRRRKRKRKSKWGFYPSSSSLGNALQQLSVIAQTQVEYVLEEKLNEDAEDDSEGGPEDPVAHLHRQAAKIRKGEKIDRLTVRHRLSLRHCSGINYPRQLRLPCTAVPNLFLASPRRGPRSCSLVYEPKERSPEACVFGNLILLGSGPITSGSTLICFSHAPSSSDKTWSDIMWRSIRVCQCKGQSFGLLEPSHEEQVRSSLLSTRRAPAPWLNPPTPINCRRHQPWVATRTHCQRSVDATVWMSIHQRFHLSAASRSKPERRSVAMLMAGLSRSVCRSREKKSSR